MSWTVQEDEYRGSALSDGTSAVGGSTETLGHKPSGKYTQSAQAFVSFPPATYAEAVTPMKNPMEAGPLGWGSVRSPASAAPVPLYTNRSVPSFGSTQSSTFVPRFQPDPIERSPRPPQMPHTALPRRSLPLNSIGGTAVSRAPPVEPRRISALGPDERDMASSDLGKWGSSTRVAPPPPQTHHTSLTAAGLRGHVYETAKDQHGCRHLQRWLDTNYDPETLQVIMNEIAPHVAELMTDQYANFLVQKLFDIMPDNVRYNVACVAAPELVMVALTPHGTFSVQKMIETISSRDEMEVVREALSGDVARLVKDTHGNHVIQKVLQRFDYVDKQFIYDAVMADCSTIAKNKQGCCVLQRCLEYASPMQRSFLVKHILSCCLEIVQDPFGNYVIQYVLDSRDPAVNDTIAATFLPHLVHLCINKFSSNVMEKVLRGASVPIQEMYVETLCNQDIATRLIQDDYGNYVLQTALMITTVRWAERLIASLRPLMPLVKNAPYAKKLEAKMEALVRRNGCDGASGTGGGPPAAYRGEYNTMPRAEYTNGRPSRGLPFNSHHRFHEPRASTWQPS